ncbi:hypothetical protein C4D60_Mb03t22610 [Musa balbisiana]|uniref:Secreted protein n=1 Tax=Musa balbisiana TaxID=52838 RepID=A0A4S8JDL0_MUSBA|nr:hypothetical protein C4D60_Mb03t22610 [Musa balbisiana]
MFSVSFGLWCTCISCLATSVRPLLIRRSRGQQLTEGPFLYVTPSAAGREAEQGVRTSRRRKEMHQAKIQLGSEIGQRNSLLEIECCIRSQILERFRQEMTSTPMESNK